MSSLRIDYVKIRYSYRTNYPDEVLKGLQRVSDLEDQFRACAPQQCNFSFSYESDGWKNTFFEAWGLGADALVRLDPQVLFEIDTTVTRLDIRRGLKHTPPYDGLETLLRDQRRRNVTRINSRPRTKKGDRDGGGYGLRVGSHQAIRSVILYQRGDEQPAIELTMRGAAVGKFLDELRPSCLDLLRSESAAQHTMDTAYELILNSGYASLVDFVATVWGAANIPFVMNGGAPDTEAYAKLASWLSRSLSSLPPSLRAAVLATQEPLFPD